MYCVIVVTRPVGWAKTHEPIEVHREPLVEGAHWTSRVEQLPVALRSSDVTEETAEDISVFNSLDN